MHVCHPNEIKELKELLHLLETYDEWSDDLEPYTFEEAQKIDDHSFNRMMFLLKKYYRTLWL